MHIHWQMIIIVELVHCAAKTRASLSGCLPTFPFFMFSVFHNKRHIHSLSYSVTQYVRTHNSILHARANTRLHVCVHVTCNHPASIHSLSAHKGFSCSFALPRSCPPFKHITLLARSTLPKHSQTVFGFEYV